MSSDPSLGQGRARRGRSRRLAGLAGAGAIAAGIVAGAVAGGWIGRPPAGVAGAPATPSPSLSPSPTATTSPSPTATPRPTPTPTPRLVAAPLTGLPVSTEVAARRVLAVMVDDLGPARPQSGFNAASIVWHAPAEGGIPRYMLLFQDEIPSLVGPIRSSRPYYIAWAAEWRALYAHVGGSPEALRMLREQGQGELVHDADQIRWGEQFMWRTADRPAPHNVYSDGEHLRAVAAAIGAIDEPLAAAWWFGPPAALGDRPVGGTIDVPYLVNRVRYRYDRETNRYRRSVTGASPQVDAADGEPVAPANVVVLTIDFAPADDGQPAKGRLEADVVGEGRALIATNGTTIRGTWRKDSLTAPTLLFDRSGRPVTLTAGQTFVQVVPVGTDVRVVDGKPAG